MLKVIISGGGTGGHIYPAIAIADAIKELKPNAEILFVGALGKMEMEKVPEAGYKIIGLWISGIQRKLTFQNLLFPFKLIDSLLKARKIIKRFQPNVAVGVGGYASAPTLQAATNKGIPSLLQEQNSYAGLTNKILSKSVKKICVAYPNMENYFPSEKIIFSGNPVRKDILELNHLKSAAYQHFGLNPNKKTLLVTGGSLGALTLNESVKNSISELLKADYQLIWQTGKFYIESIKAEFENQNSENVWFNAFIRRMDYAYAIADVVVARAGALSISELCLAGKPSILVPSPNVAEDHQTKNAMALVNQNAAILIKDTQARTELMNTANNMLSDTEKQNSLIQQIKTLAKPNAATDIAKEVIKLASSLNEK